MAKQQKDTKPKPTNDAMADLLSEDPVFRVAHTDDTKKAYMTVYQVLMDIVSGVTTEEMVFDKKKGELVSRPVTQDTRVKAAALLMKITMDKMIPDKKDTGHEKGKGAGMTYEEALVWVEEKRKRDREAKLTEAKEKGIKQVEAGTTLQ